MAAKRGNHSEETLREAVRLVQDKGYSYGDVFKLTGVPKTTLFKYAKSFPNSFKQTCSLIHARIFLQQGSFMDARLFLKQND